MSAPAVVASIVAIFGAGLGVGILVGFSLCKRWINRQVEALDRNSQFDLTGVHHIDTRAKTPIVRPRADKDNEGNR
jgi:hypothetical protein